MTYTNAADTREINSVIAQSFYQTDTLPVQRAQGQRIAARAMLAGRFSIIQLEHIDIVVNRKWRHIRERRCDFYTISFPLSGEVSVTQDSKHGVRASVGEVVITCGDRPHLVRTLALGAQTSSQLHVLVPSHVLRTLLPNVDHVCGRSFDVTGGSAKIAFRIVRDMILEADNIDLSSSEKLTLAALECLTSYIRQNNDFEPESINTGQAHLQRVLSTIQRHLSSQGLTAGQVAESCNISRRYLHELMQKNGISFNDYLWDQRLTLADQLLTNKEFEHFHIVDIAYMSGFRGASHFSRCYRTRFGFTPSDARITRASGKNH